MKIRKASVVCLFIFLINGVFAQTLIINEVSNGPSGNKEYVEFVVVSDTITFDCYNTNPPCVDIRGWIFDDNSGYHGSGGVAAGAVRFSQDNLWSCVPIGTIILIYNDGDPNPAIPADDLSLNDGNCQIIAPISSTLFELNGTTPGAVACSYPSSGWTPGGSWSNTLLANSGDCARIVNLAGCEVFSVCWGSNNQNNLIYFSGSGSQKVWYFNDGDPNLNANWTSGNASPSPGDQTPGSANNTANAAYIAQFNNGCSPITPLTASASVTNNASCSCDGSASASASGSMGGYTFTWYDDTYTPTGQTGTNATGLCPGTYHVIVTSGIGCEDTATVTITGLTPSSLSVNDTTICTGQNTTLTAITPISGGTYLWSPGGQTTASITVSPVSTTSYSCTYSIPGCSATATGTVTVTPSLVIDAGNDLSICSGTPATLSASGADNYFWDNGLGLGSNHTVSPASTTTYIVYGSNTAGCTGSDTVTVNVLTLPTVNAGADQQFCPGTSTTLTASGDAASYHWDQGVTDGISFTPTTSNTYTVTGTGTNGCQKSDQVQITLFDLPTVNAGPDVNACTGNEITLNATGNAVSYTWDQGVSNGVPFIPSNSGVYQVSGTSADGCISTDSLEVTVTNAPALNVTADITSGCAPLDVTFTADPAGISNVQWTFSDGTSMNGGNSISKTITSAGCMDVSLTADFGGCTLTGTFPGIVCTDAAPNASFTPSQTTISEGDSQVSFFNNSTGAVSYLWQFGDYDFSTELSPVHDYAISGQGNYRVVLTAVSSNGCVDSTFALITVEDPLIYYVPNAFTPDGDEFNNTFQPVFTAGFDPNDYTLSIFNRWGETLYVSHDPAAGWDGTYAGQGLVKEGTYVWRIEFKTRKNDVRTIVNGHLVLIR